MDAPPPVDVSPPTIESASLTLTAESTDSDLIELAHAPAASAQHDPDAEVEEIRELFAVFTDVDTPPDDIAKSAMNPVSGIDTDGAETDLENDGAAEGGHVGVGVAAESVLAAAATVVSPGSVGAASPPQPGSTAPSDGAGQSDDPDEPRRRWRRGKKTVSPPPRPAIWRRVGFAAVMVILLGGGATLAYVGSETVRDSTDGQVIRVTDDPTAPGFEAFVTPSPTMLVIHNDGKQVLGYTLLVLGPNDAGGAIVFIPTDTIGELPQFGEQTLSLAYEGGGAPVATQVIQDMLGTGILDVIEIDGPRWTTLTEPVAPFTFVNPDQVIITDPETGEDGLLFPSGEIQLEAVGVGQYLSETSDGESELARIARDEIFWTEWLAAIAAGGDGAVPGEVSSGIGRFARGLANGPVKMVTLPVSEIDDPDRGKVVFLPSESQIEALVTDLIPLPTSPAFGVRPKVRLLNGTTDPDLLGPLVTPLVQAGAEVTVFGNASSFAETTTQIIFTDPTFSDDARAYQEALGVGEIIREERPVENVDITIVIGSDYTGRG